MPADGGADPRACITYLQAADGACRHGNALPLHVAAACPILVGQNLHQHQGKGMAMDRLLQDLGRGNAGNTAGRKSQETLPGADFLHATGWS